MHVCVYVCIDLPAWISSSSSCLCHYRVQTLGTSVGSDRLQSTHQERKRGAWVRGSKRGRVGQWLGTVGGEGKDSGLEQWEGKGRVVVRGSRRGRDG